MRIVDPQMKDQALLDAFGRRIRELRTARGLSQEELAFQTGDCPPARGGVAPTQCVGDEVVGAHLYRHDRTRRA